MTVLKIVKQWLEDNGYDGLMSPGGECSCLLSDLAHCCKDFSECRPSYRIECDCKDVTQLQAREVWIY